MAIEEKKPFGLSEEQRKNLRVVTARATVRPLVETDDIKMAMDGILPRITDGEPTKLLVTAWMVHEGINNNRLMFRAEDLPIAAAKIKAPNFLPMDWNHAAVFGSWDPQKEPPALGVWYEAEAKMDPAALEGKGALGIEVKGIVWAWAFPEKATEMLAMQAVQGYIEFSMACVPESFLPRIDGAGKWFDEAVNPVFFTLSALSVTPGDPDAKGTVTNVDDLSTSSSAATVAPKVLELTQAQKYQLAAALKLALSQPQEATMDEKALEAFNTAVKAAQDAAAAEKGLREAAEAKAVEALTAKTAADEATQAEKLKADALTIELAKAVEAAAAVAAELETVKAKLVTFEAAEAARVQTARWTARMAELPESYRTALSALTAEEQTQFEARWVAAEDAVWAAFTQDLKVAFSTTRVSYLSRSTAAIPAVVPNELRSQAAALLK